MNCLCQRCHCQPRHCHRRHFHHCHRCPVIAILSIMVVLSSSCHRRHLVLVVMLLSSSFFILPLSLSWYSFFFFPSELIFWKKKRLGKNTADNLLNAKEPEKKHGGGDWFSLHYWTDATAIYSNWSISHQFIKPCLGWLMQKKTKTKTKTKTTVVEHVFIYSSITDRGSQLVWALFIFSSPNDDIQ